MNIGTNYKITIITSLILLLCLINCSQKYINNHFDLKESINVLQSNNDISKSIKNQIDSSLSYFTKEDYIPASHLIFVEPWRSSIDVFFDLYVDNKILNNFVLVFTNQNTERISIIISQTSFIEISKENKVHIIYHNEFSDLILTGMYDIYGFCNETLIFKTSYQNNMLHKIK